MCVAVLFCCDLTFRVRWYFQCTKFHLWLLRITTVLRRGKEIDFLDATGDVSGDVSGDAGRSAFFLLEVTGDVSGDVTGDDIGDETGC